MYYTYMIRCKDNSIYTGITKSIERRWQEHLERGKKCAKYTKNHPVKKIEAVWQTDSRTLASKLEFYIKKLKKEEKESLLQNKKLNDFFEEILPCNDYQIFL